MTLSICVYCGSGTGTTPDYAAAADQLGGAIGKRGYTLVYGGGNRGLMGRVASATKAAGGKVTGIIPRFFLTDKNLTVDKDDVVLVDTMHDRKMLMFERSDAFVALPGGIGTLEELVEQMTWSQLGRHRKPIVLADINGFWRPFRSLLAHMRQEGFIRPNLEVSTLTAEKIEDVIPIIEEAIKRHGRQAGAADWSAKLM